MFKKSKPKIEPPPMAPSIEEMLADMETFEVNQPTSTYSDNSELEHAILTEPENLSLSTWWQVFDEYDQKVKKLSATEGNLETQRNQLKECYAKLEKNADKLRDGIKKQQALAKEALKC
ncbi:uncharacterized protein LOC128259847 [Drosophila gunungcola]|uniref:Uncharacterized protein n=1 Tax=Drosophila gunungcola TaxID=103775 RepID=A0A9P9Z0J1_9MUSC|nr:uncharacterized protein LOC128259847 [Drosophila gunungcola]KAI8046556.1 hypothetical protein M5D96_002767 [Drosophila gunungcola]